MFKSMDTVHDSEPFLATVATLIDSAYSTHSVCRHDSVLSAHAHNGSSIICTNKEI